MYRIARQSQEALGAHREEGYLAVVPKESELSLSNSETGMWTDGPVWSPLQEKGLMSQKLDTSGFNACTRLVGSTITDGETQYRRKQKAGIKCVGATGGTVPAFLGTAQRGRTTVQLY